MVITNIWQHLVENHWSILYNERTKTSVNSLNDLVNAELTNYPIFVQKVLVFLFIIIFVIYGMPFILTDSLIPCAPDRPATMEPVTLRK